MNELSRQIRLIRRETDRLLCRITREVFGNRQASVTARRGVAEKRTAPAPAVEAEEPEYGAAWRRCCCEGKTIKVDCPEHGLFNRLDPAFAKGAEKPGRGRVVGVKKY